MPFKVCYLFKAVQTFTERWQPWNAEAGLRLRAAAVGNRCSPQPLQTRSPSGKVSTQTVPEICGPDSDRSRQQPHTHTLTSHTQTKRYSRHTAGLIASLAHSHTLTDTGRSHRHHPSHTQTHTCILTRTCYSCSVDFVSSLYFIQPYLGACIN